MEHRFQVHLRGIIDLLGKHLYSSPKVFVRELLQNAVDAIRARFDDPTRDGEIVLEVSPPRAGGRPTLTVTDNGIGLTEDQIHRFLATIGESSKRWADRPRDFLGQFGIGLLSCFMVSDEIVVITQADGDSPAMEWRGNRDGTYTVKKLDAHLSPGTRVYLTCDNSHRELFTVESLRRLARLYGEFLPVPIRLQHDRGTSVINAKVAPWDAIDDVDAEAALRSYSESALRQPYVHGIPLRSEAGKIRGVAFVLPQGASATSKRGDRIYLKNMLLAEHAESLLPDWAFFVTAVYNAGELTPSASRDALFHDERFHCAREELGDCVRDHVIELAQTRPELFQRILDEHVIAFRTLALHDDQCFELFVPRFHFETTLGPKTIGEILEHSDVLRYVADLDQFRQIAPIARAQGLCLVNAGYIHQAELLDRYARFSPDVQIEVVEPSTLSRHLAEASPEESRRAERLLAAATRSLRPLRCAVELRRFLPANLPVLYIVDQQGRILRSLEQASENASPLWSGILGNVAQRDRASVPTSRICLNAGNDLIQRLIDAGDSPIASRAIEMLYVQALLLGHHPLSEAEIDLLSKGMSAFIEFGIGRQSPDQPSE